MPIHVRRRVLAGLAVAGALVLMPALIGPAAAGAVFVEKGAAIRGYDPVAYFTEGRPVLGKPDITFQHQGAVWRFASVANRDRFAADPARYAPQYGGFCAWAVSRGYTAEIDPEAWKIEGGKLYLNYSKAVQTNWAKDIPGNIAKADANWPKLEKDLTAR